MTGLAFFAAGAALSLLAGWLYARRSWTAREAAVQRLVTQLRSCEAALSWLTVWADSTVRDLKLRNPRLQVPKGFYDNLKLAQSLVPPTAPPPADLARLRAIK